MKDFSGFSFFKKISKIELNENNGNLLKSNLHLKIIGIPVW